MASRGRGRGGRGRGFTFDIGQIGFQKGEALPAAILQPPPLFPTLDVKPVPLINTDKDEYLLALKQEFRGIMQESQYFIKPDTMKKDIDRYSDKYKAQKINSSSKWEPDWSRFPQELKIKSKRRQSSVASNNKNTSSSGKKARPAAVEEESVVTKRLEELEKKGDSESEEEGEAGGEQVDEEQDYDEEDQEEDNDYLVSHYDDGEEVGFQDDDDMDEGPIY